MAQICMPKHRVKDASAPPAEPTPMPRSHPPEVPTEAYSGGSSESRDRDQRRRFLALQEAIREYRMRMNQMERTVRWWADCTQGWREKWQQLRTEHNSLRLETNMYNKKVTLLEQRITELTAQNERLSRELEEERLSPKKPDSNDVSCQVNFCLPRRNTSLPLVTTTPEPPVSPPVIARGMFFRSREPSSSHSAPSHLVSAASSPLYGSLRLRRGIPRRNLSLDYKVSDAGVRGGGSSSGNSSSVVSSSAPSTPQHPNKAKAGSNTSTEADATTLASHYEEPLYQQAKSPSFLIGAMEDVSLKSNSSLRKVDKSSLNNSSSRLPARQLPTS